jgi:GAF domain-containing protein
MTFMTSDQMPVFHGGALGRWTLDELELVDAPSCMSLDGLTGLAATVLDTPVALVSIVELDWDRQFFTSQVGLPDPWAAYRQTPLSHSFCQHVMTDDQPLIVTDSRVHPRVKDNLAIPDLNVIAYLGVPVRGPDQSPLGAMCVIDGKPREWSARDLTILSQLADCVSREIQLRAAILNTRRLNSALKAATGARAPMSDIAPKVETDLA